MAQKRTKPTGKSDDRRAWGSCSRRRGLYVLVALAAGAGALGLAYAQSGSGYSINLNSPVSFPVDI